MFISNRLVSLLVVLCKDVTKEDLIIIHIILAHFHLRVLTFHNMVHDLQYDKYILFYKVSKYI